MADPIKVKLTSAQTAMQDITTAIQNALSQSESELNTQLQNELKLQSQLNTLEDALNLAGSALNGPPSGLHIPTTQQLLAPLRKILQKPTNYPCDANPFAGATQPSAVDNASGKNLSPPITDPAAAPGVINFWIQSLIYGLLAPKFDNLLKLYSDSPDIALEEEVVSYIQTQVTSIIQQNLNIQTMQLTSGFQYPLNPNSSPPPSPSAAALDEGMTPGVTAKITLIENQYVDLLNGDQSPVFPPPGGTDFLTNLENLIMLDVNANLQSQLGAASSPPSASPPVTALSLYAMSMLHEIRLGVQHALDDQITELGIQGTLLADAYDNETSIKINQNLVYLLNSLDDYNKGMGTVNSMGMTEALSIGTCVAAVTAFEAAWDSANITLSASEMVLSPALYTQLYSEMNPQTTPTNQQLLNALLYDPTRGGGPMILANAESLSTQVSSQLAGLNFMAISTLVKSSALNQTTTMSKTVANQFSSDIDALKKAFTNYGTALSNYYSADQQYKESEMIATAAMGVEGQISKTITASPSINPTYS